MFSRILCHIRFEPRLISARRARLLSSGRPDYNAAWTDCRVVSEPVRSPKQSQGNKVEFRTINETNKSSRDAKWSGVAEIIIVKQ